MSTHPKPTPTSEQPANWAPHALEAWQQQRLLRDELQAERVARIEAETDRDSYKLVAQEALHALADLTERHRRQTARYHALLDDRRAERTRAA